MRILFNELKNYKVSLLLILISTYISTTFELMLPLLLANALNIGIIENYGLNYIKNIAIMMLFFITISIILNIIISHLTNRVSIYASSNIRDSLFSKIISLNYNDKSKFSNSSLITRTNQDIEQIKNFIGSFINIIFKAPILFISCITVLQSLNKNFSILLIISIIIILTYLLIIIFKLFPLSKQIQTKFDDLNLLIKEKISGIKTIKSYNNLEKQDCKFKRANKDYLNLTQKVIKTSSFVLPILNLIINTLTIIILIMSVNLVKNNSLEIGSIIASIQYILQILLSIIMLSMIIILTPKTKVSINRIEEILTLSSNEEKNNNLLLNANKIEFNNVSLTFGKTKILNNINITINKKDKIGIIGSTGSGKSTLIKLLFKENTLYEGNISIDNYNLNDLSRKDITTNITYLPQQSNILTGTILENIAFANPNITMEELSKIIYTCNLTNFINEKKEKINYKIEENGSNLSGGQKQRISLARALAKNNDTIILDEPFSAIDYKNEKEIINNLNSLYKEKTILILSQKISSIKDTNKIIVMDKGEIIAIDTHENLLKSCTLYKEMYIYQKEVLEYDI